MQLAELIQRDGVQSNCILYKVLNSMLLYCNITNCLPNYREVDHCNKTDVVLFNGSSIDSLRKRHTIDF